MTIHAGNPTYLILEQSSLNKCNGNCVSQLKNTGNDDISFRINSDKSVPEASVIKEVNINGDTFKIDMIDQFSADEGVPFYEVEFSTDKKIKTQVYALKATTGSAGTSFHYFVKDLNGKYRYSGMHPEIFLDEETNDLISMEKDGSNIHVTTWKISKSKFQAIKSEVVR